jgi:hypothetical protein
VALFQNNVGVAGETAVDVVADVDVEEEAADEEA